eukprot:12987109-Alexandrium_andersonii.AAC.1
MASSGQGAIFAARVRREEPTQRPVVWVPRLPDDQPAAYRDRCLQAASQDSAGLAWRRGGGASLG